MHPLAPPTLAAALILGAAAPSLACTTPEEVTARFTTVNEGYLARASSMSVDEFTAWSGYVQTFSDQVTAGDLAGACATLDKAALELGFGTAAAPAASEGWGSGSTETAETTTTPATAAANPYAGPDGATTGRSGTDVFNGVAAMPDGGMVLVGSFEAPGRTDASGNVLRLDASGAPLWEAVVEEGRWDRLNGVTVLEDGSVVAVGAVEPGDKPHSLAITIWIDGTGTITRKQRRGGNGPGELYSIIAEPGRTLLMAGNLGVYEGSGFDGQIFRITNEGKRVWTFQYTTDGWDEFRIARSFPDGRVAAAGMTDTTDGRRAGLVVFLDAEGNQIWETTIAEGRNPGLYDIIIGDGTFTVFGAVNTDDGGRKAVWVTFSADGEILRSGLAPPDGRHAFLAAAPDGKGGVIGGAWKSVDGVYGLWIVALDAQGALLWERHMPGERARLTGITARPGGGWLLSGVLPGAGEDGWAMILPAE